MRRSRFSPLLFVLLSLACIVLAFLVLADPLFDLDFGLIRDRRRAASSIVALSGRDLMLLNTVEAIYKVVFPYDYVAADTEWRPLLSKSASGAELTAAEASQLEVYRLAADIGIDLQSKRNDFVVVTAIAKIGLDLEGFAAETRNVVNGTVGPVSVRSDGTVVIDLPPVVITDLIISDASSADYDYPDISIPPEGWKRLSAFVSEDVALRLSESGLFDEALERAEGFLRQFFREAGYESVNFAE